MKSTLTGESERIAKFKIGDIVTHQRQGYRAVVVDVDPLFQASGRYNPQACKRFFSQQNPWYRLLVDNCSQETYVEEPLLILDPCQLAINNPNVAHYLVYQEDGYHLTTSPH